MKKYQISYQKKDFSFGKIFMDGESKKDIADRVRFPEDAFNRFPNTRQKFYMISEVNDANLEKRK